MSKRSRPAMAVLGALALAGAAVAALADGGAATQDSADAEALRRAAPICSSAAGEPEPSFHSEMTRLTAEMHRAMHVAPTGDVDRDFATMMIPHHQGAIDMSLALLKFGRDEKLRRLAQAIIVEQGQEISYMRRLLDAPRPDTSAIPPIKEK